jgi:hypothetical protein
MDDRSAGPVQDGEVLNLLVSDPAGLLPDGSLNPIMLVQLDFAGVSVLRNSANDSEFLLTIQQLKARSAAAGKERFFHGVCAFSVATVRYDNGKRLLGVYDTALVDKPNHADMVAPDLHQVTTISKTKQEHENRRRHKRVIELIGASLVPARQFRQGAFTSYAR